MQSLALKFKQTFCAGFLSLAILSIPSASLAVTVEEVPNPRQVNGGWVTDMADILSSSTEAKLNQLISELEAKNGSEIAVVTVPDTAPAVTPKKLATSLFNHWGIGKADQDNGVLFLISKGERRVEIEMGYGVEKILPDARVGNIIEQEITPRLKKGDFDGGTLAGTKALVMVLKADDSPPNSGANQLNQQTAFAQVGSNPSDSLPNSSANKPDSSAGGWVLWVLIGLGTLIGVSVLLKRASSDDDDSGNGGNGGSSYHCGGSSGGSSYYGGTSSGSTSSGGGGSFGGGDSGGGGAGGSF